MHQFVERRISDAPIRGSLIRCFTYAWSLISLAHSDIVSLIHWFKFIGLMNPQSVDLLQWCKCRLLWMHCIHFVVDSLNGCFIEPALVVWLLPWLINTWSIDPLARWFCIIDALNLIYWLVDSDSFASIHWLLVVASLSHWCVVSLMHWNIEPCFVGFIDPDIGSVLCGFDSLTHRCIDSDPLIVQPD